MIEVNGPWGFHPQKKAMHVKILIYLSDGSWRTAYEIADAIGVPKQTVTTTIMGKGGLSNQWVEVKEVREENGSKHNEYRLKCGTTLRPCPWCNHAPRIYESSIKNRSATYIVCECGIRTKIEWSRSEAIWSWNRRFGE